MGIVAEGVLECQAMVWPNRDRAVWLVGCESPEMRIIESVLRECSQIVAVATGDRPKVRVRAQEEADRANVPNGVDYCVACGSPEAVARARAVRIDPRVPSPHADGPEGAMAGTAARWNLSEVWDSSCLAQVVALLLTRGRIPSEVVPQGWNVRDGKVQAAVLVPDSWIYAVVASQSLLRVAAYDGRIEGLSADSFSAYRAREIGIAWGISTEEAKRRARELDGRQQSGGLCPTRNDRTLRG